MPEDATPQEIVNNWSIVITLQPARPDLVDEADPALTASLGALADQLMPGAATFSGSAQPGAPATNPLALAAWSVTHGYATLALAGNLPTGATAAERAELTRSVLRHLAPA